MGMFMRRANQRVQLTTDTAIASTDEQAGLAFTVEQVAVLAGALGLPEDTTADDVVAAVTALAEKTSADIAEEVAASTIIPRGVTVDAHVWRDMKRAVQRGLTLDNQEHRLAAEQVVDQAIRLAKASPGQREQWIAAYQADPETTLQRLNRAAEIPRVEIGYSGEGDLEGPEDDGPAGWVR